MSHLDQLPTRFRTVGPSPARGRPRMPALAAVGSLCVLASAGCTDAGGRSAGAAVRDSAGIEIVESAAPAWSDGEGWTLSSEPVVQVGVVEGAEEYQLDGVVAAVLRGDGTLLVANSGSSEIRMYDTDGGHLRSFGGAGEGPGEFQTMRWMGLREDSIAVWDSRAKRLSIFAPDGEFVRSFSSDALLPAFSPIAVGLLGDGTLIGSPGDDPRAMMAAPEGEYRGTWTYVAISPDGTGADTVLTSGGSERWLQKTSNGFSSVPFIFARDSYAAVGAEEIFAGDSDRFEIVSYGPDGSINRLIRRAYEPIAATDADARDEMERRIATYPTDPPSAREGIRASLMEMEHRPTLPAFTALQADVEGNLWVQEPHLPRDETQTWSVFDGSGRWLGRVALPSGLRVRHITDDRLVGTWKDDLDVEHVQVYAIHKP